MASVGLAPLRTEQLAGEAAEDWDLGFPSAASHEGLLLGALKRGFVTSKTGADLPGGMSAPLTSCCFPGAEMPGGHRRWGASCARVSGLQTAAVPPAWPLSNPPPPPPRLP